MKIDFGSLPDPEPSSQVGFSKNELVRDSENRDEGTLRRAIEANSTRYYLFSGGKVLLQKDQCTKVTFSSAEADKFSADKSSAILLGDLPDGARVALDVDTDTETLEEPWMAYDLRSLLYSGSVSEQDAGAVAQAGSLLHWNSVNQFCGKCGSKSACMIGGYRRDCPSCGNKIFPRTDPVVIMLTVKDNMCLLGRSPHFPEGWYSTLAGFVEPGETMEDAVRRETFEESGIRVGRVKYHASQPWPFPHSLMIGVHCEALSEDIQMDESELEDCRWFSREDVQLMMREEHPDGFICPPNKAISSALIQHWAMD